MKPLEIGEIYAHIGRLIVKDLGISGEGAFLYAEAGRAWAGGDIPGIGQPDFV